jgi:hypothetical protein
MMLPLNHAYSLRPGEFHALLEDHQGTEVVDFQDVQLKRGRSYVAMRVGLGFHWDPKDKHFYSLDAAKNKNLVYYNRENLKQNYTEISSDNKIARKSEDIK